MIDAKLDEEVAEYHKDQNLEEPADLLEVIYAAAMARGYNIEELERTRAEKAAQRGTFTKKLILKEIIDICQKWGIILSRNVLLKSLTSSWLFLLRGDSFAQTQ